MAGVGRIINLKMQEPCELSFLYGTHRQHLFVITVRYNDNIPNGKLWSRHEITC